jgi:plastocyanin
MIPIRYLTLIAAAAAMAIASLVMPNTANAGGGCHQEGTTISTSTSVALVGNCFAATVTRVDEGATVTFHNEDDVAHNVTGAGYTWGGEPTLFKGDTFERTFEENGVYVYSCLLHPGMVGAIVVGDGSGDGGATLASYRQDDPAALGVGNPALPETDANSTAASTSSDSSTNTMLIAGAIAAGIVLLIAIAAGSIAFGRALADRKATAS